MVIYLYKKKQKIVKTTNLSKRIRDGNPSNFWTGFRFLQESVQKKADSRGLRIRIPDSSNIFKGFF